MTKKMSKRRRKRKRNPWDGLRKEEIKERWPFKVPIIEHLVVNRRKLQMAAQVLEALKMKVRATDDGEWFDIIGVEA